MTDDWATPDNVADKAVEACETIRLFALENHLSHTGGCKIFRSPAEWRERGEACGEGALLVVVYDGAAIRRAFEYDWCDYESIEAMAGALQEVGVWSEAGTCWYSVIYPRVTVESVLVD